MGTVMILCISNYFGLMVFNVMFVPVKQKTNRFNPDEIRATKISLGRRDKLGWSRLNALRYHHRAPDKRKPKNGLTG
jgi:hypothetical protein